MPPTRVEDVGLRISQSEPAFDRNLAERERYNVDDHVGSMKPAKSSLALRALS